MKVQILASCNVVDLLNEINDFIKDKNVIDIKYNSLALNERLVNDRVLIIYEEKE